MMIHDQFTANDARQKQGHCFARVLFLLALGVGLISIPACGGHKPATQNREFFTSGSREADQRASQTMAKQEQLTGSGEGDTEKKSQKAKPSAGAPAQVQGKLSLYDRLGAEPGLTAIVSDFIGRAIQDPRVNWQRNGVKSGSLLHRKPLVTWNATPDNVAAVKTHMVQFFALATGGPAHYEGKEIKSGHAGMRISNPEFDAAVGDLKASLDKLQIPNQEQKELLSIVESTRPEIVEER